MCLAGAGTEGEGSEAVEHCSNVRRADTLKEEEACGKRHFCAIYILKRSFCQDRLGTNIGKTHKREAFVLRGDLNVAGVPVVDKNLPQLQRDDVVERTAVEMRHRLHPVGDI